MGDANVPVRKHAMTPEALAGAIIILTQTYAEENFIGEDERLALVAWVERMTPYLVINKKGPFRRSAQVRKLPTIDPHFDIVRRRVMHVLNLPEDTPVEEELGAYISVISPGGVVHRHRDPTPAGTRHLRCNLFLQLPEKGGRPIIADVPLNVAPRTLLAFYPSDLIHYSEPFEGDARRVLLSFGYTVPDHHRLPPRKPK